MNLTGSCECGRVTFSLSGTIPDVELGHCSQYRKTSGHSWASVLVPDEQCKITSDETLKWRRSSDSAQRGFCTDCGSSLFYKHDEENKIAVAVGALETPTDLGIERHIFVKDKGDYYQIPDHEHQLERY